MKTGKRRSRISGFHKMRPEDRVRLVIEMLDENGYTRDLLFGGGISTSDAEAMLESVIGIFSKPLGLVTHAVINEAEVPIPMCTEEPSIIAALSRAMKMAAHGGGVTATADPPIMIAQIQLLPTKKSAQEVIDLLEPEESELVKLANESKKSSRILRLGGGAKDIEFRIVPTPGVDFVVLHLLVDVRDAMGASLVNAMAEAIAPKIEELTGERVGLRIVSNLSDRRLVRAGAKIAFRHLKYAGCPGKEVAERIVEANLFAKYYPHRATTHNKGIMNGVIAVALATGNDTRAIEAGAHAYAARDGQYSSLTEWRIEDGDLVGELEMPMAVGTVGGFRDKHPIPRFCREIMGVESAKELAEVMAAVGLMQNLAALQVLVTSGIQAGFSRLS